MKAPSSLLYPVLLALTTPISLAAVAPLDFETSTLMSVDVASAASMDIITDFALMEGGVVSSASGEDLELLEDGQPLIDLQGHAAGRHFVVRDEGSLMRYIASCTTDLSWKSVSASSVGVEMTTRSEIKFDFEITGSPMRVKLQFELGGSPSAQVELVDTVNETGLYDFSLPPNTMGFNEVLAPGTYNLRASMNSGPTTATTLRETLALQLLVTEDPAPFPLPEPERPAEGCFTHPDIVTHRPGGDLLTTLNPQVLSETDLAQHKGVSPNKLALAQVLPPF